MESKAVPSFLRYPGGKQRMLPFLSAYLPHQDQIAGRYIEPFLGGGSVFFHLRPLRAELSDVNSELILLYCVIQRDSDAVWDAYRQFPKDKETYWRVRGWQPQTLDETTAAARLLFLNRTCFKGMWRHNRRGEFNVGYGGESRRWVVSCESLREVAVRLQNARLRLSDFENTIDSTQHDDFVFLDPPYTPGAKETLHRHYVGQQFSFADHQRLADCLGRATRRGVRWLLTTSSHPDIVRLFAGCTVTPVTRGTGAGIGRTMSAPGEVLIAAA